jgi:alkanesulfonate monooxygenase SsuD/methylene tetrahydromethanopterin reductase-like flavin-dependent oxidoreductase (luciferase family)
MRTSAFSILEENGNGSSRDRYREVLELAETAERIGLDAFWVAEHHFQPGGLCPAPAVLLAAIASRTTRLRLGSLVSVLPFHEPVDTAEQYALVDRISQGRLNFGVGSGYVPAELEGFGVDPESKRERFDRALDTILRAWEGGPVTTERAGSRPVHLNIRPAAAPHPPIWVAVQRREAIPYVARRGFSLALIPYATISGLEELQEETQEFRAALPAGRTAQVSAAFPVYAGADPASGLRSLQRYLDSRRTSGSVHYLKKVGRDPRQADAQTIVDSGLAFIGKSAELPEWLGRVADSHVDELLGIFDFGGLPLADSARSMRAAQAGPARGP